LRTPRALDLDDAEGKQNYGKRLVLQIFEIMGETVPPALWTKGPQLGVAEDEQEQSGKQKASRPRKAKEGPAPVQRALAKNENAREDDEKPGQMMVEFTFFLVGEQLALLRGVHLWLFVHGHRHGLVSGVVWMRGVVPCRELRRTEHEQRSPQGTKHREFEAYRLQAKRHHNSP